MKKDVRDPAMRGIGWRIVMSATAWWLIWLTPHLASSATRTWTGGSALSSQWNYSANWLSGSVPQDGDDLVFPAGAARLVNTNTYTGRRFRSITLSGGSYSICGNAITVSNGITVSYDMGLSELELPVTLGASQILDCSSATAALLVTGDIDLGTESLTIQGAGSVVLNGVISGLGGLTKDGSGTLWLGGTRINSYRGETRVNSGTLQLNKDGTQAIALGNVIIGDDAGPAGSAQVWERRHNQFGAVFVTIHSDGWLNLDGANDTVSVITLNGGTASTGAGTLSLAGVLIASSSGGVISGQLDLGNSIHDFDVASGGNVRMDAVVSGTGGINKTGSGFLTLAGTNTYSGLTTVQGGTVEVHTDGGLGSTTGGTVLQTGTLRLVSAAVAEEPLEASGGKLQAIGANSGWAGPITLTSNSTINIPNAGQLLNLSGPISGAGGFIKTGDGTLVLSGTSGNTYHGSTVVNAGTLLLGKTAGTGVAIRYGNLTIGDGDGGDAADVVRFLENNQFWSTVPVTITSSGLLDLNGHADTAGALTFTGGRATSGSSGGLLYLGSTVTATNGSGTLQGNIHLSATRTFNTAEAAGANLYVQARTSGLGGLTKTGPGQLYLSSSNRYEGLTTISEGLLYADNDFSLGAATAGAVVSDGAALVLRYNTHIDAEELTLNGHGQSTLGALASIYGSNSWAGPITLATDALITVQTNQFLNLAGPVTGPAGFSKAQPGTLILSGSTPNTFAGNAVVNEGTLLLAKSAIPAIAGAALIIGDDLGGDQADVVRELANSQIATIPITVNSSGRLDLDDHTDTVGHLTMRGGTIDSGTGTLALAGDVTLPSAADWSSMIFGRVSLGTSTRLFDIAENQYLYMRAQVSGTGGITKTGEGVLHLSSSNSYAGLTTLADGHIGIQNDHAFGSTTEGTVVRAEAGIWLASVHVGAESLRLEGPSQLYAVEGSNSWTGDLTLQSNVVIVVEDSTNVLHLLGAIGGPGGFAKRGEGTLMLGGANANTYAGTTYVHQGVLHLAKGTADGAIPGPLVIGDNFGGAASDIVRLGWANQIANTADITLSDSGLFDLNNYYDRMDAITGSGSVTLGSGHLIAGHSNSSFTFDGLVSGTGYLWKVGGGAWTLTANNTYRGTTRIETGTLLVNGAQPGSDVWVQTSGTLGGEGTVGDVTADGSVAPGSSPGLLSSGNLAFTSAGNYSVELNNSTPGTGYDQLNVRGSVALGNAALVLSAAGLLPTEGEEFVILRNDATDPVVGTFAGRPEGALISAGPRQFLITYAGGTGNDVVLIATNTAALRPTLTIWHTSTNTVVVAWPLSDIDWRLQATTNLATSPIAWTEIRPPYQTNRMLLQHIESTSKFNMFYRLESPN